MEFTECVLGPLVIALCLILYMLAQGAAERYEPLKRERHRDPSSPFSYYNPEPMYATVTTGVSPRKALPLQSWCGASYETGCELIPNDGSGCCTEAKTYDCDYASKDVGLLESCGPC